nr:EAL domain-containing protein [Paraglaciecola sp. G1-23]
MLTSLTIIVNVWLATTEQAQKGLDRDLKVAQNVLEQVLSNRENLLFNSAGVLTDDFGFKQAVASEDTPTIKSALQNHGARINADVMALISLNGKNIASTPTLLEPGTEFPYQSLIQTMLSDGGASALIMLDKQLYQVIMLTVDAPAPLAIALVGFKLDQGLVNQLNDITQLETTIEVAKNGAEEFSVSTLEDPAALKAIQQNQTDLNWYSITIAKDIPFVSRQFILADEFGYQTQITLSEDVDKLFAEFNQLQLNITVIGALAIVIAMLLAALFSRKLAKPLVTLSQVAQRISSGNYTTKVEIPPSTQELDTLSTAFTSMQSNIKTREEKIVFQARHDTLTSLSNRHYIETLLDQRFVEGQPFLAIGINIFGFRGINDIFGYHNGDLCLKELASRVAKLDGLAARLTGGELLWVPSKHLELSDIEKIKIELEKPIDKGEVVINLKVAMGLLYCPEDAKDAEQLFRRMNIVLDEAQISRQFILRYDFALEDKYLRRLSIITELKNTLTHAQHELNLFYQPKLNLKTGKVESVEALIRWTNAKLGFVSPEDFIATAEHAGFIELVTQWVIERAIKDAATFQDSKLTLTIAINLSARDVMNTKLLSLIKQKLAEYQLDSTSVSFEITEGDLVKDHQKAIEHLKAFQASGFSIAIDDFGTGYSSMAYLQSLPVNTLKVDKSFVLNLDTQVGDQQIVKTVISLAHAFELTVVAEGIENLPTLQLLAQWGCEWAQGYYICKPAPAEQLIKWCHENKNTQWLT